MRTKDDILRELDNTDRRTRALLEDLDEQQLTVPYDRGINPPIWELGHAAFFYEYFLLRPLGSADPRMPGFDEIWDSFEIRHEDRWRDDVVPGKQTALDYYTRVIDEVRARLTDGDPDPQEQYLCQYGIGHQNMHIESMIWCRQTIGYPAPTSAIEIAAQAAAPLGDAQVPGGEYEMGVPGNTPDPSPERFSFDNERPGHRVALEPFRISKALVSNGEFLAFVEDGGYEDEQAWSFRGRAWLAETKAKHPLYWRRDDSGAWQTRRFDRFVDLPLHAPAMHLCYWEAEAFCKRAGRRLPTEREWEAAARGKDGRRFPWGDEMDTARVDMDGRALGAHGVDALADGAAENGCVQMIGTAWEWTSTQFLPYDGFSVDVYPYMSTLQFGDHTVARGGSCATSSCLIRSSYRQSYLPTRRDAFTGFRTCAV
ncbi:MAG: selenoneine synthase SenA [Planctomycetota bacterium]